MSSSTNDLHLKNAEKYRIKVVPDSLRLRKATFGHWISEELIWMYKANQFNPMLSEHLDLYTLCQSETAERLGIHNTPHSEEVLENLRLLCLKVLNPTIVHFDLPIFVTSGYRCPRLNVEVGGLPDSQHLLGQAADIMMGGIRNDELALWIIENLDFDEVILEKFDPKSREYGWVHVSYSGSKNRKRVMTFDGTDFHEGFHYFDLTGGDGEIGT